MEHQCQYGGLGDGGGRVLVNPSNNSAAIEVTPDPVCHEVGAGDFECVLGAKTPTSFNSTVITRESAPTTQFAFEVLPAPGVFDANPTNNIAAATVL